MAGLAGSVATVATAIGLGLALDLPTDVIRSLVPKSVTAPVAMGLADRLGGVPAMAAVFAVLTGMVGAISAKALFGLLRVHDWSVRGFALGTTSHGIGAARAMQVHPDAGAYAGLALALQVLLASLWMPWLARWWGAG
jgi:putative effector of murein hydrolase